jgi:hypothetical protein
MLLLCSPDKHKIGQLLENVNDFDMENWRDDDDTIMMKLFKMLAFVFSGRLRNADKKIQQLTKPS